MDKAVNILDRKLFSGEFKKIKFAGYEIEIGKLNTGQMNIAAVILDENDSHYHEKLNYILRNHHLLAQALILPDEATTLWLESYEDAIVNQSMNQDKADEYAWNKVRAVFHQTETGWIKLSEHWFDEVSKQLEPTVQVLSTGKYTDSRGAEVIITVDKLDEMVRNFSEKKFLPNVTIDHNQAGPSMGTVKNLFRVGNKLYATLTQLVPAFVKKVKANMYKYISSEYWDNYIDGAGKYIGGLFTTVSFLGSKKPAIKDMDAPAFSEHGVSFALISGNNENTFVKLTEPKPLKTRKEGNLAFISFETQKEFDDYVKARIDTTLPVKLAETEKPLKDKITTLETENKKLSDEKVKLAEADKTRKQSDALKFAEAEVAKFTSKEKMRIPPKNEASMKNWKQRFERAYLAENSEAAIKALQDELEGMPDLVKFGELDKGKGTNHPDTGSIVFSEANQDKMAKVRVYMDGHKYEYKLSETGMILPKVHAELGIAIAAVANAEN